MEGLSAAFLLSNYLILFNEENDIHCYFSVLHHSNTIFDVSWTSFMPINIGAERDLRFVYCAGKKQPSLFSSSVLHLLHNKITFTILMFQLQFVPC